MDKQKGFAVVGILIIILILAAVGAGVYLIQYPQVLKSRASAETVVVKDANGNPLPKDPSQNLPVTSSLNLKVNLNVPSK